MAVLENTLPSGLWGNVVSTFSLEPFILSSQTSPDPRVTRRFSLAPNQAQSTKRFSTLSEDPYSTFRERPYGGVCMGLCCEESNNHANNERRHTGIRMSRTSPMRSLTSLGRPAASHDDLCRARPLSSLVLATTGDAGAKTQLAMALHTPPTIRQSIGAFHTHYRSPQHAQYSTSSRRASSAATLRVTRRWGASPRPRPTPWL